MENRPKVAVEIIVRRGEEILLLERKFQGDLVWCLPGGHLEYSEEILDCAKRELKEETSLRATDLKVSTWLNNVFVDENKHYITFIVEAECAGEPVVMETEKFVAIKWFNIKDLPKKLFPMFAKLVESGYFK